MSRRALLAGLIALVSTACRLDAKEHHGQQWQHEIVGARGYFAGNPTQAFAITDEHGDPIWGGACLCAGTHLIYQQFRNGDIPANEVTELVEEGVDVGAKNVCKRYAEMASMVSNNCDEAVAALTELPVHTGTCSFWADSDFCDIEFEGTDATSGSDEDGLPDMMGAETDTGDTTDGGPVFPVEFGRPWVSVPDN